ncbi:hypothetical protein V8E53_011489 [Lactarius tabidus]
MIRNSLAISLIDPVVFLRGVDFSRGRHENSSPSILRGLLTLCLTKPTRISSIEVELIGQSLTTWSEGSNVRPVDMREENKLFSATQTFFQAPQSTSRRASSVDPVLFSTPGEDGPIDRRHASSPSLIHSFGSSHFFHLFDPPRGRRSRFSVDGAILPRAHPQEVRSRSPPARDSQSPPSREDTSVHPPTGAYMWASEEHKDTGDGWQEFKKGLYTFPISFTIPSYMPPTLSCDYGSVTWRLKANVHRPGAFTPKLSASRDVLFVASPSEDLREDAEGFAVERVWGDQMQYSISVSGRMFPIGGSIPITLSFLPMAKVKIFKISAQLEEQVIFYTFEPKMRRTDAARHFSLLSLETRDKFSPVLPHSPTTDSPLQDMPSEVAASLMGPGPWTLQLALKVPNGSGMLHFSNKNKRGPIQISHALTIMIRVERGDDEQLDPKTGKRKRFDVILQMPVHILSPLASAQHVALPRYTEREETPFARPASRTSSRRHSLPLLRQTFAPQSLITAGPLEPFVLPEEQSREVDMLYERSTIFERLISGQQSEAGVEPPAYSVT